MLKGVRRQIFEEIASQQQVISLRSLTKRLNIDYRWARRCLYDLTARNLIVISRSCNKSGLVISLRDKPR